MDSSTADASSGASSLANADPCAYAAADGYFQPLNIGAVFIIITASVLGTCIPLVSKHYPAMQRYPFIFIWGKHVGTGVILALALIHLLAPAFSELGNPCLPPAFSVTYQYAPLFALLAALAMQFIETMAHQYLDNRVKSQPLAGPARRFEFSEASPSHTKPVPGHKDKCESNVDGVELESPPQLNPSRPALSVGHLEDAPDCVVIEAPTSVDGPQKVHIHSHKHADFHAHSLDGGKSLHTHGTEGADGHMHSLLLGNAERTVAAYILEFGLTSHSVIIGITVGVAARSELHTLIPALCFHQFFEGFALGARLAEVGFSIWNEVVLMLIYSLSCPMGIAIGIGIQSSYNSNGVTTNLVEGTFDAISAGILLYVGFVQMMGIEFPKDYKAAVDDPRKQIALWLGLWFGVGVLAFIGKYL